MIIPIITPTLSSLAGKSRKHTMTTQTPPSSAAKPIPDDLLRPQDFADVFGGPPRTILSHHLSATGYFYDDIFLKSEKHAPLPSGRNLPLFKIPPAKQSSGRQKSSFFSDIFSWDPEKFLSLRSRSRSKTNSSSALSSEELSPLRPAISDDVSLLASKPRPINVKTKWDSSRIGHEDHKKQQKWPSFQDSNSENEFVDKLWNCTFQFSQRNLDQMSFGVSENDVQFNSPSSAVSSDRNCEIMQDEMEVDQDVDDDELMSSYVIELDSSKKEPSYESNDVDEAIAWAKEKFQKHSSQEVVKEYELSTEETTTVSSTSTMQDEMSILDEKMRWWLIGKESDIRLQLSSLHHILWPNSGWIAISLANLIESSQVKKAYQKAVLCLHPDKLQQRGETLPHKYIAEKAFAALQEAWTKFTTLDVSCR